MRQKEFVVSFEGVGAAGKSVQSELLRKDLSGSASVSLAKGVDRVRMLDALWAFRDKEHETLWVTNLPKVEPGVDMLALVAMMKQQYHDLLSQLNGGNRIILFDRYVDTAFTRAGAKFILEQFPDSEERIEDLHKTFIALRYTVRWPDATILVDTPLEVASIRGGRREGRTYSEGDYKGFKIVAELYTMLARREPERFFVVDGLKSIEELHSEIGKFVRDKLV